MKGSWKIFKDDLEALVDSGPPLRSW